MEVSEFITIMGIVLGGIVSVVSGAIVWVWAQLEPRVDRFLDAQLALANASHAIIAELPSLKTSQVETLLEVRLTNRLLEHYMSQMHIVLPNPLREQLNTSTQKPVIDPPTVAE